MVTTSFEQQKQQEAIHGNNLEKLAEFFKKQPILYPEWQGPLEIDINNPRWERKLAYNRNYWNIY